VLSAISEVPSQPNEVKAPVPAPLFASGILPPCNIAPAHTAPIAAHLQNQAHNNNKKARVTAAAATLAHELV
jgi:hypothetical protein